MLDVLHSFRRSNSHQGIPETGLFERFSFHHTENIFLTEILALLDKNGLTLPQSINFLERSGRIDELEQRVAKRTTG